MKQRLKLITLSTLALLAGFIMIIKFELLAELQVEVGNSLEMAT